MLLWIICLYKLKRLIIEGLSIDQTVDGRTLQGPQDGREGGEPYYRHRNARHTAGEYTWPPTSDVEYRQMVNEAFGRADSLQREHAQADAQVGYDMGLEEDAVEDEVLFGNVLQDCVNPLYDGCSQNRLQAGIVLMTLSTVFGVSDNFLTSLLTYLAGTLLPRSNSLPRTTYELKSMIRRLGLEHERIHCCPDGHILFEGEENSRLTECPQCGRSRYVPGSTTVPSAVLRYFPLIDKLRRIYKCPKLAKLLNHYEGVGSTGGVMTSVADSLQWREITRMYPEFSDVSTHLRLALIADGVCPHGNQSSKHSTFIILVAVYNFPGWLASKNFFINLSLLIPGPKAPTSETMDVYLKPLVRDLLQLWHGIPALNMAKEMGSRSFVMRGILMWTVHDFPAYGLISGQTVKGYVACPICGGGTCSEHSGVLNKMVYLGCRRFLSPDHRFRRSRAPFNNSVEDLVFPNRRSGTEILELGRARAEWLREGGVVDSDEDPVKQHGVKRASILFALPYWKVCDVNLVQHVCLSKVVNIASEISTNS